MIVSLVSLLLLVVAAYFLVKTKPNLLLFDFMKEVFGNAKDNHADEYRNEKSGDLKTTDRA